MMSDCHLRSDCVLTFLSAMNLLCVYALLPIEIDLRAALEYPPSAPSRHLPPQGGKENKRSLMRVAMAVVVIVVVVMIVRLGDFTLGVADHERVDHAA